MEPVVQKMVTVFTINNKLAAYTVDHCSKPQSKLPRHDLISIHGKETEVIKYEIEKDKGKIEKMIYADLDIYVTTSTCTIMK